MTTITEKTEFARRVKALGLTLVELEKLVPFTLSTLQSVSDGRRRLSPKLDWALKRLEEKHKLDKA